VLLPSSLTNQPHSIGLMYVDSVVVVVLEEVLEEVEVVEGEVEGEGEEAAAAAMVASGRPTWHC